LKKKKKVPENVGSILDSILLERGYYAICKEYEIMAKWDAIVGPRLAKVTECSNIDEGILYVKVASAPWRQELIYLKGQLFSRIQKETGCTTIKDIVFH